MSESQQGTEIVTSLVESAIAQAISRCFHTRAREYIASDYPAQGPVSRKFR